MPVSKPSYPPEPRREAVRLAQSSGKSRQAIANDLVRRALPERFDVAGRQRRLSVTDVRCEQISAGAGATPPPAPARDRPLRAHRGCPTAFTGFRVRSVKAAVPAGATARRS